MKLISTTKSIVTLLVLDFLWIYFFMNPRYQILVWQIQKQKIKFNYYSAIGAYLLMVYLLVNVVIKYKLPLWETFLLGFAVYGIYDLTCGAIFKEWDFKLAIIDMLWGGFVFTLAQMVN